MNERERGRILNTEKIMIQYFSCLNHQSNHRVIFLVSNMLLQKNSIRNLLSMSSRIYIYTLLKKRCTFKRNRL